MKTVRPKNDRRKEQTSSERDLPKCQVCRRRKAMMKTIGVIPCAIFICSACLAVYESKGKPLRHLRLLK